MKKKKKKKVKVMYALPLVLKKKDFLKATGRKTVAKQIDWEFLDFAEKEAVLKLVNNK